SIVNHTHQKAAYCGVVWFDSEAYPEEYRGRLYMGNIHGNCINVDELQRDGASYKATARPDFLSANDAWFMPVSQKVGPDGCLYILDWYDRYHCYQDANRDPEGIDRLKGRIYRVRYRETPRRFGFDLGRETDEALIARLGAANIYDRETAQRLLTERLAGGTAQPGTREALEALVGGGDAAMRRPGAPSGRITNPWGQVARRVSVAFPLTLPGHFAAGPFGVGTEPGQCHEPFDVPALQVSTAGDQIGQSQQDDPQPLHRCVVTFRPLA
ncbi:MAG: hypothetical protein K6T35_00815, partial [Meiothermus silvanus]|nr:hypothetical protein [Allomeiothermus silvanus]